MTTTLLDALYGLNTSLDNLARALQSGEPDQVLAAEMPIAEAVHRLAARPPRGDADGAALRASLIAIRVSLGQCQSLGWCIVDLTNTLYQGEYGSKGRLGRPSAPAPSVTSRN
jgi:hypothetical protein